MVLESPIAAKHLSEACVLIDHTHPSEAYLAGFLLMKLVKELGVIGTVHQIFDNQHLLVYLSRRYNLDSHWALFFISRSRYIDNGTRCLHPRTTPIMIEINTEI